MRSRTHLARSFASSESAASQLSGRSTLCQQHGPQVAAICEHPFCGCDPVLRMRGAQRPGRTNGRQIIELEVTERVRHSACGMSTVDEQFHAGTRYIIEPSSAQASRHGSAEEAARSIVQILIEHPRPGVQLWREYFQLQLLLESLQFHILHTHRLQCPGRTGLDTARLGPSSVEKMRVEGPLLRNPRLVATDDGPVRRGLDKFSAIARLARLDDDDAIGPLVDGAIARRSHARCVLAVVARLRDVGDVHHPVVAPRMAFHGNPVSAGGWHRCGVAWKVVTHMLIFGRQHTVLAIGALGHIDDQGPLFHALTRARCCHFSICTRQELGAMPSAVLDMVRAGVSRFRQPPRSTGPRSESMGSYSALDSLARTTPGRTNGEMTAAQITAPRALYTLTRSC